MKKNIIKVDGIAYVPVEYMLDLLMKAIKNDMRKTRKPKVVKAIRKKRTPKQDAPTA